jgi:Spy/CpxP family protein refolding chaperone
MKPLKTALLGAMVLPLLAGIAAAQQTQPIHLTNAQMDKVTAGFDLKETDIGNTSWTQVSIYHGALTTCPACYLTITNPAFSVESAFGPTPR